MTGYELSRRYFDWAMENREKTNPTMTALFFWIVEVANRLGWREKFSLTAKECMEAIGISSYNTYKKNFDLLQEYGFIEIVTKSKNQYQANIIALSKFDKALDEANTFALSKNDEANNLGCQKLTKQCERSCDIHKTNKPINKKERFSPPSISEVSMFVGEHAYNVDAASFIDFYASKGWKVGNTPMKDWKAAVRTWNNRNNGTSITQSTKPINF